MNHPVLNIADRDDANVVQSELTDGSIAWNVEYVDPADYWRNDA